MLNKVKLVGIFEKLFVKFLFINGFEIGRFDSFCFKLMVVDWWVKFGFIGKFNDLMVL